jgi:hypothetical protein
VVAKVNVVTSSSAATDIFDAVAPLIAREIAAIGALDAAIAREPRPDYVSLFQAARTNKQANVEQMATMIRMSGDIPPERARARSIIEKAQTIVAEKLFGTTAVLQAMRLSEFALLEHYSDTYLRTHGLAARGLRRALNRTIVHMHIITAHLAKRTQSARDAARLPFPLDRYFAGASAKACMRCHFDRPGVLPPLERSDPHPYTYVCAGCHDDVMSEFPEDLSQQMERWPKDVREARATQMALGRGSKLHAAHTVLHELSGLAADAPTPAAEKARALPDFPQPPTPAERTARVLSVDAHSDAEADYVASLFDYRSVRAHW